MQCETRVQQIYKAINYWRQFKIGCKLQKVLSGNVTDVSAIN